MVKFYIVILQTVGEQVTTLLMEQDDILSYMFTLLAQQKTFINACQLIEDMLQSKKILLDLNKISRSWPMIVVFHIAPG